MKKVMFIILTMFIALAVTNCSEDVTGVATGGGSGGPGGEGQEGGQEVAPGITLSISGTLNGSVTVTADSDGNLIVDNNGTAVFGDGAILTLTGIYTASITTNAITLTEPNGTDSAPYYVASFDATTNTATLTTTEPNPVVYTPSVTGNILTIADTSNDTTISGYITEFDNGNNTLTLTNPSTNYIVNVDNNNAITVTESNNTVITNLYVISFDATTNTATLTDTPPTTPYPVDFADNILTVTDPNDATNKITGYIDSLLSSTSDTLIVKVGDVTITISDGDNDIIEAETTLTISNANGLVINRAKTTGEETKENSQGKASIKTEEVIETNIDSDAVTITTRTTTTVNPGETNEYTTITTTDEENGNVKTSYDEQSYSCSNSTFTPIVTPFGLQNISTDKDYCLKEDITLTAGFEPIGYPDTDITSYGDNAFTVGKGEKFIGTLDGERKAITALTTAPTINKTGATYIGLFAYIANGGKVENLTIENLIVKGKDAVGVLAGYNAGTIENVEINGTSGTAMADATADKVGGLVGWNEGGTIIGSSAAGDVKGKNQVGGLVGDNNGASIENSYATGYVTGTGNKVGGLVGDNSAGSIGNSYATGYVTGTSEVGGLLGRNENGTITNSYFDTSKTQQANGVGEDSPSGVTGYETDSSGAVYNNATPPVAITADDFSGWFDDDTWQIVGGIWPVFGWQPEPILPELANQFSGQITISVDGYSALKVEEVTDNGTDIADVNAYTASFGNQLLSITDGSSTILEIAIQDSDIFEASTAFLINTLLIDNTNDLVITKTRIIDNITNSNSQGNANIKIEEKIEYNLTSGTETTLFIKTETTVTPTADRTAQYTTIITDDNGNVETEYIVNSTRKTYECLDDKSFTPIVTPYGLQNISTDKDYCLKKDITLTPNFEPIGFPTSSFSNYTEAEFDANGGKDFTRTLDGEGKTITGLNIDKTDRQYVALFARIGSSGTVQNLTIQNSTIKGKGHTGVLAGYNLGNISNVEITGTTTVIGATNGYSVGGLVGLNKGTIQRSSSTGAVSGNDKVGGLVGEGKSPGQIKDSYATGAVDGKRYIGGLLGQNFLSSVIRSYATGTVTHDYDDAGGLLGRYVGGDVTSSYFDITLTGETNPRPPGGQSGNVIVVGYSTDTTSGIVQNTNSAAITESDFSGWNFYNAATNPDGTWTMAVGQWPTLRWQTAP